MKALDFEFSFIFMWQLLKFKNNMITVDYRNNNYNITIINYHDYC